jgi:hypothetical protein
MSRAELKEEGHKALHKGDFNAAIEFYNMVCYCSFCGPEVNFFALLLLSHLYKLHWITSLSDIFLHARANYT